MTAERAWKQVAPGVFLLSLGAVLAFAPAWQWIFVVVCGMSAVNALVKSRWLWLPHPLLWAAGLSFSYATGKVGGWPMFWMLCGGSVLLSFLLGLLPVVSRPPSPPRRPGAGTILDAERVE
ncbi:MAG: hypothetical protein L6R43_06905 [Planctomycetes bacterium]|nr:hypothetical protein [Planctomycetota bacterium]